MTIVKPYMPICGEDYPLSDKQKRLMSLAYKLGKNKFAPRAAQLDRDAQFPYANYDDMREAGLLALCVCQRCMAGKALITPPTPWSRQKLAAGAAPRL